MDADDEPDWLGYLEQWKDVLEPALSDALQNCVTQQKPKPFAYLEEQMRRHAQAFDGTFSEPVVLDDPSGPTHAAIIALASQMRSLNETIKATSSLSPVRPGGAVAGQADAASAAGAGAAAAGATAEGAAAAGATRELMLTQALTLSPRWPRATVLELSLK